MAKAIRRATKRAVSPTEAVARQAEELADDRFELRIAGSGFVTTVDGEYSIDVAKMYQLLLAQ